MPPIAKTSLSAFVAAIAPNVARVVDERREEVDREDDRALVVEPVDRGVVRGIEADEEILGLGRDEPGEQRLEPRGRVLRRAAAGASERRQRDRLHAENCRRKEIARRGANTRGGEIHPLLLSP